MEPHPEPKAPEGMRPHNERIKIIGEQCPVGKKVAVCVDDKPEYINYYLQELAKLPNISITSHGKSSEVKGVYAIFITRNERCDHLNN